MRLSGVCVLVSAIWAMIGIVPGVWMQVELLAPGAHPQTYEVSRILHAAALGIALPLTSVAALGAALFSERRDGRLWRAVAVTYLVLAGIAVLAAVLPTAGNMLAVWNGVVSFAVISAAAMGAVLVIMAYPGFRVTMALFSAAAFLALSAAGVFAVGAAYDSRGLAFLSAQKHAVGVGIVLLGVGVSTVWAGKDRSGLSSLPSQLICAALLVSGWLMVSAQARLGVRALNPDGYISPIPDVSTFQFWAALSVFLFSAIIGAAIIRLFLLARLPREHVPDAFT